MVKQRADIQFLLTLVDRMIREEVRGQRFFADAAQYVSHPEARRLFQHLSQEEGQHIEVLRAEKKQLEKALAQAAPEEKAGDGGDERVRTSYLEFAGEQVPVFEVLDQGEVEELIEIDLPRLELFRASDFEQLLADCTLRQILKLGMRVEYDNFQYLVELAKAARSREARAKVLKLAQDEKEHFLWLRRRYDKLGPEER